MVSLAAVNQLQVEGGEARQQGDRQPGGGWWVGSVAGTMDRRGLWRSG